ncbi:MAG TPA: PhzF family phenazine biosynthesis protein, partial [Chitinophagaceae bacterium]
GDDKFTLDFPSRMPVAVKPHDALLKSLGISDPVKILKSRDYFVVLNNEDAVRKVSPDFALIKQVDAVGVIITARGESADVVSRCFYPSMGVPEDPVTGSAHCNIIPYWCNELGRNSFFAKQLSHRGGDIWCELLNDRVMITGHCAEFMKGEIFI